MKLILQLFLIFILWDHVELFDPTRCGGYENVDLRIPENSPILRGEKNNANDSWYQHIVWLDTPAGDLTLDMKLEYEGDIELEQEGTIYQLMNRPSRIKTSEFFTETEQQRDPHDKYIRVLRKALGLYHFIKLPGKIRVSPKLFTSQKCQEGLYKLFQRNVTVRMFVEIIDDSGDKILTGQLLYEAKGYKIFDGWTTI